MTREPENTSGPSTQRRAFSAGTVAMIAFVTGIVAFGVGRALPTGAQHTHEPADASTPTDAESNAEQWHCPMHPSVVKDHPGECPICGMKLMKVEKPAAPKAGDRRILFYRSPMNPQQTSPVPKKDEMGMDYVPVYAEETEGEAPKNGLATVDIDPQRQQLIGLSTAPVERGTVGTSWRSPGRVAVDETRVRRVNVKVGGFVEKVFVDFTGKPVRRGEPLFSLYSPELYSAQQEYLLALRTRGTLAQGGALTKNGDDLVASARRKLKLWDIPDSEIDRLEKSGEPQRAVTLYSPISGVVTKKDVVEGARLEAGATPYEIVDLSQVWVVADVYESQLQFVKVGLPAAVTLKAFPNRAFDGKVAFLDPLMDPATRTVKVRITVANKTGELRPEMFGEVTLRSGAREALRIPVDAVIDSGTHKVVFVALGEGKFQPREVELGVSDGGHVEVTKGLTEGEQVVTRANFLIDSESRLKPSLSAMNAAPAPDADAGADAAGVHEGHAP